MKDSISSPQQLSDILCVLTLEFSLVWAFWFSAVHDDISEASHGDGEATGWDTTIKMFKASTDDGAWRWRLWTWMRLAKANHRWCWWWTVRWDGWHTSAVNISHRRRFFSLPIKMNYRLQFQWIFFINSAAVSTKSVLVYIGNCLIQLLSKVSKWKDSANKLHLYLFAFFWEHSQSANFNFEWLGSATEAEAPQTHCSIHISICSFSTLFNQAEKWSYTCRCHAEKELKTLWISSLIFPRFYFSFRVRCCLLPLQNMINIVFLLHFLVQ